MSLPIYKVALPTPLPRLFDYIAENHAADKAVIGCRVEVPFGRQKLIGCIIDVTDHSDIPASKLRSVNRRIDADSVISSDILELLKWSARYYHHPIGEVFATALPVKLRQGASPDGAGIRYWLPSEGADPESLSARAVSQRSLLGLLLKHPEGIDEESLDSAHEKWRYAIRELDKKGLVHSIERPCWETKPHETAVSTPHQLNAAQQETVDEISISLDKPERFLLHGVTGSGKTEVYLEVIEQVIARGRQVLVLVPEIGLTPQLVQRFRDRLAQPIALLHSNLNDSERLCSWAMARSGAARVVIGTRSAIFTPLPEPGLIIIDEEHDASFKQQEGFRYHARDLAVMRAQSLGVPIIMGSATPSLESLARCRAGAYQHLKLDYRAGAGTTPTLNLIDMRRIPHKQGLSETLVKTMHKQLSEDGQILLFLNRRGFAPTLLCEDCGWIAQCSRCDARMTWHEGKRLLRCHHCGAEQPRPHSCPECTSENLYLLGEGTERIEQELEQQFPDVPLERFDRDSVRRKGSLESRLARVQSGESRIIIGTQMLAKGHDFPGVTLVGILDSDQGLFSADFRAAERMAQLITQVAGRAGRGSRRGEVMIQTHHPEHPLLQALIHKGFEAFSEELLSERQAAGLPPYAHIALLRVEAQKREVPPAFIEHTMRNLGQTEEVIMLGPVPALMERRAGRYRYQLLLSAEARPPLHRLLKRLTDQLGIDPETRKVRWSLDVDPIDLY